MNCPRCTSTVLLMSVREGVEIDYCPQCRGVWLDRDELDKILERSPRHEPRFVYQDDRRHDSRPQRQDFDDDHDEHDDDDDRLPDTRRRPRDDPRNRGFFRQFFDWD